MKRRNKQKRENECVWLGWQEKRGFPAGRRQETRERSLIKREKKG